MGCHALLQGILPTQGSDGHLLGLLRWQVGSLSVAPPRKPLMNQSDSISNPGPWIMLISWGLYSETNCLWSAWMVTKP